MLQAELEELNSQVRPSQTVLKNSDGREPKHSDSFVRSDDSQQNLSYTVLQKDRESRSDITAFNFDLIRKYGNPLTSADLAARLDTEKHTRGITIYRGNTTIQDCLSPQPQNSSRL